jgi:hypothetical protein
MLLAVIKLAELIGTRRPSWAMWGCLLTMFGLFARTFHSGVDHLAFQIVRNQSLDLAINVVADSYGAFHIFSTFNLAIMLGWIVLAIGAYRSGTLPVLRSAALALMVTLPLGVLKGSTLFSILATTGLCIALMPPLGIKVLRDGPMPGLRLALNWFIGVIVVVSVFFFFGQQG